jgi:hypothetical protein
MTPELMHRSGRPWRRLILVLPAIAALTGFGPVGFGPAAGAQTGTPGPPVPPGLTWSTLSPPVNPPALANASAVYDGDNKTVVLFGGLEADGTLSNDTWVWNGSTWADYPGSQIQAPPARQLAAMAFDPDLHQLILFGGESAGGQPLSDTWAWNGASWYQQSGPALSGSPSPREGAAMAYDGAGNLVLFGGTGPASGTDNTSPGPTSTTPAAGSATSSSAVSTTSSVAPLIGLADTWLWTSDGWLPGPAPGHAGPSARSGPALAFYPSPFDPTRGQAVLFGGESTPVGSAAPRLLGDSWAWTGGSWTHLAPKTSPPPRARAIMVGDDLTGGVVLFGGTGPRGALADTWLWNGTAWSATLLRQPTPVPRAGAAVAYDPASHRVIVFGGAGPAGEPLSDTLALGSAPLSLGTSSSTTTATTGTQSPSGSASPSSGANLRPPAGTGTSWATVHGTTTGGPASTTQPLAATLHVLHRGDLVTLTGSGFRPGATITITFHSRFTVVGRAFANKAGDFSATVAVPESSPGGTHHFEAAGLGPSGAISQVATITVVGVPGTSSTLQRVVLTGAAFLIPAATWCVLVGLGWWRRRSAGRVA